MVTSSDVYPHRIAMNTAVVSGEYVSDVAEDGSL